MFSNIKWPMLLLTMLVSTNFFARIKLSVKFLLPLSLFYSCLAKVNAESVSIDSKGYTTMVKLCLEFVGN